eukprot:624943-Prymnesium_polylepis.1
MCRKLVLVGWVLLIHGDAEQARVLMALFVSIVFFGLNLRFRPQRRCAVDGCKLPFAAAGCFHR